MVQEEETVLEAAKSGNLAALKLLDDKRVTTIKDKNGATCLHYAARGNSIETLEFLLKKGFNAIKRSNVGATAAHDAAATGSLPSLQWILANTKLSVDDQDGNGATVLHLAARYGHAQTVKWLVENSDCDMSTKTASCALPLHFAVAGGNMECVKILLNVAPSSVNIQTNTGETPVYLASQHGHLDILKCLILEAGGSTRMKAFDGMSLLHAAAQRNHLDCVKWLIEHEKVNPNDRDFDGTTPLHFACSRGHTRVVEWMLQHGGGLITLDNLGGSPLHNAAEMGRQECIQVLLENGCDSEIIDNNGFTAAELAEKCNQQASAALIRGEITLDSTQFPEDIQLPRLSEEILKAVQSSSESCPPLKEVKTFEEIRPLSDRHISIVSVLADVHTERHDSDCSVYSQETGESEFQICSPPSLQSPSDLPPPTDHLKDFAAAVLQDSHESNPSSAASTLSSVDDVDADLRLITPSSHDDHARSLAGIRSQFELFSHTTAQSRETQTNFFHQNQTDKKIKMSDTNGIGNAQVANGNKKMTVIQIKGNNVKINDSAGVREITTPPGKVKPEGNSTAPSVFKGGNSSKISVVNNSSHMSASGGGNSSQTSRCVVNNSQMYASGANNSNEIARSMGNNSSHVSSSGVSYSSQIPRSGADNSVTGNSVVNRSGADNSVTGNSVVNRSGVDNSVEISKWGTEDSVVNSSVTVNAVSNGISKLNVDSNSENISATSSGLNTQASEQSVRSVSPKPVNPSLPRSPLASILLSTAPRRVASPPSPPTAASSAGSSPINQRKDLNGSVSSSNSSPEIWSSGVSSNPFIYQNGHAPVKHDIIAELRASSGASGLKKSRGPERGATKEVFSFGGKNRTQPASSQSENDKKPSNPLVGEWDPKHFLDKVPEKDANGHDIPDWKRHMMAKHEAEKSKKETEEKRKVEMEEARFVNMPAWKRALIEKKEQTGAK